MGSRGGGTGAHVLYLEGEPVLARAVVAALDLGPALDHVASVGSARARLTAHEYRVVVLESRRSDGSAMALADEASALRPPPRIVLCAAGGGLSLRNRVRLIGALWVDRVPVEDRRFATFVRVLRLAIDEASAAERDTEDWKRLAAEALAPAVTLTARQREVRDHIASGMSTRAEIAREMGLSLHGLRRHLDPLFDRFPRERSLVGIQSAIVEHALYLSVARQR